MSENVHSQKKKKKMYNEHRYAFLSLPKIYLSVRTQKSQAHGPPHA